MEAQNAVDKRVSPIDATIASSGTTSDAVVLYACTASQFQIPSAFTGTSVTFLVSIDNGTSFQTLRDSNGNAISYAVTASGIYSLEKDIFAGIDQFKIVSSTTEAAERVIKVKPFLI